MAAAAATFVWWLLVSSPQGGLVVMPNSFANRDACMAAITEFQKNAPQQNWRCSACRQRTRISRNERLLEPLHP